MFALLSNNEFTNSFDVLLHNDILRPYLYYFLKHTVSKDYYIVQKYLPFVLFRLITIVNCIIELCKDVTNLILENGILQILQYLLIF